MSDQRARSGTSLTRPPLDRRRASLFLGKDEERWAHMIADPASDSPWKVIKSVMVSPPRTWENHDPITHKFASSLGIAPASAQTRNVHDIESSLMPAHDEEVPASAFVSSDYRPIPTPSTGTSAVHPFRQCGDRTLAPQASALLSPTSLAAKNDASLLPRGSPSRMDMSHPILPDSLTSILQEKASLDVYPDEAVVKTTTRNVSAASSASRFMEKAPAAWCQYEPTLEARRDRRSKLLRSALKDYVPTPRTGSPEPYVQSELHLLDQMYDKKDILSLVPRRSIEHVEGTLYDEDGPFREGATSDSLSVRLFYAPGPSGEGISFLITTPDNRVFSAAKRRRWAMDQYGNFFAAMEIKSVESKLRVAKNETVDPLYAREYEADLRRHYIDDILDELQKAETLTPVQSAVKPHVLRTEDNKIVRLEEDFPEEAFFVIAGCQDHEIMPVMARVFADAILLVWRMHCHGWMHGDIKLENLMFNQKGVLYIIDFENASPFRGSAQHDGLIQLLSFDWTPPELEISPLGRRMGPTGDLFALGSNIIRGFALRDGITDKTVRDMLMGDGLGIFISFRNTLLTSSASMPDAPPVHYNVNIVPLLLAADTETTPVYLNPARVLRMFACRAPKLLQYVLAHCVAPSPYERNERFGVELAHELLHDPANAGMWETVKKALDTSIELSGSSWVRPKLNEARDILELS